MQIKGLLLCSFTKSWFCFRSVLEHALMLGGSKIVLFFTLLTLLQYLSPQPDTNSSISSGFDEGPPSEKQNVLWLVGCPTALWLANSLDRVSVLPHPLPKQEDIEQEDCAEPLHARILQDIRDLWFGCGARGDGEWADGPRLFSPSLTWACAREFSGWGTWHCLLRARWCVANSSLRLWGFRACFSRCLPA